MKIFIGPHTDWIGPYQIAEKVLFWMDKDSGPVDKLGSWLAGDKKREPFSANGENWLTKACQWVHTKKKRKVKITIDKYDTWNMDATLALIVLPMLKQLKLAKHGGPFVEDSDVPENIRSTSASPKENEWDVDGFHFERWDYVLDQMIWSFEQLQPDCEWEDKFHTGQSDIIWKPSEQLDENGMPTTYEMVKGPNDTSNIDIDGYKAHSARIDNGLKLFGVYFRALWD
jgi:hypothetical protein